MATSYGVRRGDDGADSRSGDAHTCPHCHGPVYRIHRRPIDRLISLVVPIRRYRCDDPRLDCKWEGNLRVRRNS